MASLLPKTRDEFGKAAFWDKFNAKTEEFEWYGSFSQLRICDRYIKPTSRVLVIGCGNSNFSAELYDSGVENITNVDFDEKVILDMSLRNIKRSKMKWEVMDMRHLDFNGELFDIVFDKGALDALMSSPESKPVAIEMVDSIAKVLVPGGGYVCISLAQEFIFSHLSETVSKHFESLNIHILKEAAGNSKHVPFLFSLIGSLSDDRKAILKSSNKKKIKKVTGACFFNEHTLDIIKSNPKNISIDKCWKKIQNAQDSYKMIKLQVDLKELKLDRMEQIELWAPASSTSSATAAAAEAIDMSAENINMKPKYTLTILDTISSSSSSSSHNEITVSAFIVPQGREHEFLFNTKEGLKQIAQSAQCSRLLSISLNRGYKFDSLEHIKNELSQTVVDFSPHHFKGKIPFITTEDGAGIRNAVSNGKLTYGDEYIVEEAEINGMVVRRLVFMTNSNVIQTEVRLLKNNKNNKNNTTTTTDDDWGDNISTSNKSKSNNKKSSKKNSKNKKNKKTTSASNGNGGGADGGSSSHPDEGLNQSQLSQKNVSSMSENVDFTYMCFDYHRAIISGVIYLCSDLLTTTSTSPSIVVEEEGKASMSPPPPPVNPSGVVIGLGGGALPMMLHHFFPTCFVEIAELDDKVYEIAKEWFGYKDDDLMKVSITDGLLADFGINKQTFVVLDVDSKDSSVGMSCPPVSFLQETYLRKIKDSLIQGGILVVNVAARSNEMYNSAIKSIQTVFNNCRMFISKASDDDANTVVFAINEGEEGGSGGGGGGLKYTKRNEEEMKLNVKSWLKKTKGQENDPLELLELSEAIKNINL